MNKLVINLLLLGMLAPAWGAASTEIGDGRSSISVEQLKNELLVLAPQFRGTVASDAKNVARFAETVLMNERVAEKARELGYAKQPEVQAEINKTMRDILANRYLRDQLEERRRAAPNFEPLAREDYEVNKSTYLKPEAFRASHILLRVDPEDPRTSDEAAVKTRAQSLLGQIRNGADFEELAKQHSEERLAPKNGGDLGWVDVGRTVPPFEAAALALKPGEVSDLVRTRFGFHIIKVHEKRPSFYMPFDEVKEQIIKKLMDRYMSERRTEILSQFEGLREIIISPEVMKQIQSGQ